MISRDLLSGHGKVTVLSLLVPTGAVQDATYAYRSCLGRYLRLQELFTTLVTPTGTVQDATSRRNKHSGHDLHCILDATTEAPLSQIPGPPDPTK